MGQGITIRVGETELQGELNDSATAKAIIDVLPIEGKAGIWGDEIYFSIPVKQSEAGDARDVMEVGELAYWPPGNAFCIFYGRTPASTDDHPRAASGVNPIGRVLDDTSVLKGTANGEVVTIS